MDTDKNLILKNTIWKSNLHAGKYEIIKVERSEGLILNIKMRNVNNKSLVFDVGDYELLTQYEYVK